MALFKEEFPFSNEHSLNLDWILKKVKTFEDTIADYTERLTAFSNRLETVEGDVTNLQNSINAINSELASVSADVSDLKTTVAQHGTIIDSFQTTLTSIEERLTIIVNDITTLYANVDRVETESKNRDNALGTRVTLLESAVINPIYVQNAIVNAVAFGDDLRFAPVAPSTNLPYGMSWQGEAPYPFTYVPDEGFRIGDDYWNSKYLKIQTDCLQLSRNATYSVTVGVFNDGNYRDPYKVFTGSVRPEYGNPWIYFDNDEEFCFDITPGGVLCLAWRNGVPGNYEGKYIRYIKVIESSTPETEVHYNRREAVMIEAVNGLIQNAVPSSVINHYTDDIESTWYMSHEGSGTEEGVNVNVDFYDNGSTLKGNISLFSPYDDDAVGNGSSTTTTINVASLQIPKIQFPGYINQYVNLASGEMYSVYMNNGSTYIDTITIVHSFPATITPQSNGHFATIPIDTLLLMS